LTSPAAAARIAASPWLSHASPTAHYENGKMRLIIVEKPSCIRLLASSAQETWPHDELIFLSAITITLTLPILPRGLAYSAYPMIAEPAFKPNADRLEGAFCCSYRADATGIHEPTRLTVEQTCYLINRADNVVCMPDYDYRGVWGVDQLLEMFRQDLCKEELDVIRLVGGYTEKHCNFAVQNLIKPSAPSYQTLLNAGRVKSYFDYNFALNSLPIFGNLYRSLLKESAPVFISKYAIQFIIYLSENEGLSEHVFNGRLYGNKWKGSGQYNSQEVTYLDGIGSPASRFEIQKQLIKLGLIVHRDRNLYLTENGLQFVARLHKDTKDYDLPFRLDQWMKMPFDEVKEKIDTYLKTFFGKQKRYQKI
jgi:DNA topoisomerase IA